MATIDPGSDDPLGVHGVVPPTVTAFHDDESLDEETTAEHAEFVVDRGVHGVFPLGTNGEFALLNPQERDRVITCVVEAVGDSVPVIAGVGAPSTRQTIAHAEHAAAVGADGVVVVTPYYYPLDARAYLDHYRGVAEAIDIPIYIYHIPSKTGNRIERSTLTELAAIPNIAGVKDSSKDIPWLGQSIASNPELTFLAGSDSLLFAGLEIGCSGMVSAIANVFPERVVELYTAYDAGDEQRAFEIQQQLFRVRDAFKAGGAYMSGVKSALSLRGLDTGPLRRPLRRMDQSDMVVLERNLDDLGLL